jgi:DNA-binding transcriptional LysR family regulator
MSDKSLDQLKRMAVFAEVVAAGSLTAAARRLGMTPSAVSQHLRQLEQALGLALLHRSTRRLTLTEAGERYHAGAPPWWVPRALPSRPWCACATSPRANCGWPRPSASAACWLRRWRRCAAIPNSRCACCWTTPLIDLIERGWTSRCAWASWPTPALVARKLGSMPRQLCASPAYLAERGWPAHRRTCCSTTGWPANRKAATAWTCSSYWAPGASAKPCGSRPRAGLAGHGRACAGVAGWGICMAVSEDDRQALADGGCCRYCRLAHGGFAGARRHAAARRAAGQGALHAGFAGGLVWRAGGRAQACRSG